MFFTHVRIEQGEIWKSIRTDDQFVNFELLHRIDGGAFGVGLHSLSRLALAQTPKRPLPVITRHFLREGRGKRRCRRLNVVYLVSSVQFRQGA